MKRLLFLILAILIALLVGFSVGFFLEKQGVNICPNTKIVQGLNSKTIMVSSLVAGGEIANISGRTLTLIRQGESLDVVIKEGAVLSSFVFPENNNGSTTSAKIGFADIKKGDNVYVNLEVLSTGDVQGTSVTVVPKQ